MNFETYSINSIIDIKVSFFAGSLIEPTRLFGNRYKNFIFYLFVTDL